MVPGIALSHLTDDWGASSRPNCCVSGFRPPPKTLPTQKHQIHTPKRITQSLKTEPSLVQFHILTCWLLSAFLELLTLPIRFKWQMTTHQSLPKQKASFVIVPIFDVPNSKKSAIAAWTDSCHKVWTDEFVRGISCVLINLLKFSARLDASEMQKRHSCFVDYNCLRDGTT